ncbi:MAG: hypothetical protein MHM6MM_003626 [Cercozoa sp. M6MM]
MGSFTVKIARDFLSLLWTRERATALKRLENPQMSARLTREDLQNAPFCANGSKAALCLIDALTDSSDPIEVVEAKKRILDYPAAVLFTVGIARLVAAVATLGSTHLSKSWRFPAPQHSAVFVRTKSLAFRIEFTDQQDVGVQVTAVSRESAHALERVWGPDRGETIEFDEFVTEKTFESQKQRPSLKCLHKLLQSVPADYDKLRWNCHHFAHALYTSLRDHSHENCTTCCNA